MIATIGGIVAAKTQDSAVIELGGLGYEVFMPANALIELPEGQPAKLYVTIDKPAAQILSTRSRLTPRIANRLLKRVRDYADINGDGKVDKSIALKSLELLDIDELGLDNADRALLTAVIDNYNGGPVGVETLAAIMAEERTTIEDMIEPYLLQIGLLERTPRGRKATPKSYRHLGKNMHQPERQARLVD